MKIFPLIILLSIFSCSHNDNKKVVRPDRDVCFLLYDLDTNEYTLTVNPDHCRTQLPAASTFKIPLSLMAFNEGILKDENTSMKWDGIERSIEAWNQDQTADSWMKNSVVWFSQEITPKLGVDKITRYLQSFPFGNADMSAGLKYAWLTPAPIKDETVQNSLKISGFEQVTFLKNLWTGELKVSDYARKMTQKILASELSPRQTKLLGKTGSGMLGEEHNLRLGWYVGYLRAPGKDYVVVSNFTDKVELPEKPYGGPEAKELAKKFLREQNLW